MSANDLQPALVDLLLFEVGGHRYALPAADVREVVRAVAIAPLPGGPPIVEGIIDVRGRIVPVLDIRGRFRLAAKPLEPADHFILATCGAGLVALRVDVVTDFTQVGRAAIEDARAVLPCSEHVAGVAKLPGGLVLIHDLKTFLSQGESAALATALAGAP